MRESHRAPLRCGRLWGSLFVGLCAISCAEAEHPETGRVSPALQALSAARQELGIEAQAVSSMAGFVDALVELARPGDLLLFMSSGSFDGAIEETMRRLTAP